ncbi:MAG: sulfatase-like hydrolase/transferase, partial [Gammaproteobacteria bacterium]|nr:sulfatase-like hydrolase/transferase [Gammaproteobacteria bacterium]
MNQISRWLLVTLVLLLLAGCADQNAEPLAIETAEKKTPGKPNVVVFYIDDLGYGDVGSYGAVGVETPVIDRLAAEGVRFTDAHSS